MSLSRLYADFKQYHYSFECLSFLIFLLFFFFFKQKTAYEMRISDWSSDVCSSDLSLDLFEQEPRLDQARAIGALLAERLEAVRGTPGVADVRTKGALGVIELTRMRDSDWLKARFIEEGIWLRPFGNIIYTTPPLTTDLDDVARIAAVMVRVTREWAERA